ncbi:WecB/TagA/CpsF family glycosyltransferase [Acidaminobacter sp. JC074]|uniref:WecB/TagA/CpsF family glycosyltransferase n=1 Tax=Acidaminobacter sp. JC074 TaxID=2530199 RepID=UPI001F0D1455|nr:WecB/TagA/CpsF family glycosyltransferase [Acidaminobacter sp. JC074]MCH4886593.1 WecB/TagA/CpsF family glycosyltransferase [Acidaminobacter sp. JC074]
MKTEKILGVDFTTLDLKGCIDKIDEVVKNSNKPFHVITANPEIVMQINRGEIPESASSRVGMITPDGIGIVYGSKILGGQIRERITGVELLVALLEHCQSEKHRIFFLGADEETMTAFKDVVADKYPKLQVAGYRNGFFDINKDKEIVEMVKGSQTDILIMGMGSPRSHIWFDSRRDDLNVKVAMDVGGGFDALTGKVQRAPDWIQAIHMEWFYRRLQNPSRKDRQKDLYRFALDVFKERFKR